MEESPTKPAGRVLDPVSRFSEILFGLIMALTFTGSLSAATAGEEEVRVMLFGAIGCNIAWGLVDAVMYVLTQLGERGQELHVIRSVRGAHDSAEAHRMIAEALPPAVAELLEAPELEAMRTRLKQRPEPPTRPWLGRRDFLGALGVFLLVVASTFPVVVPFMVMSHTVSALRVSNGIAIIMLFLCGFRLGQYSAYRPLLLGLLMAVIGAALVAITIALGG